MRWIRCFGLLVLSVFVASCGGNGHPVAPPTDFAVQEVGDTQVTLNWTAEPGVSYWVWFAPGTTMTTQNYDKTANVQAWTLVTPPFVLKGSKSGIALTNGTTYSFSVNARTGDAPGGAPAAIVTATPRMSGTTWSAGPDVKGATLRGVTSATLVTGLAMVGVGDAGRVLTSTDNVTWTAVPTSVTSNQLNDVVFAYNKFIAVGAGGTIVYSEDGQTWTAANSPVTQGLNAVFFNGARLTAVGQGGAVLTSTDGVSWKVLAVDGLTQDLNTVTWSSAGYWLAAGASGALYTSADGQAWSAVALTGVPASAASAQWRSAATLATTVTSGTTVSTQYVTALAGQAGQMMTSLDGKTWTLVSAAVGTSANLNKILASNGQFLVAGDAGTILTSPDGSVWTSRLSSGAAPFYGLTRFANAYTAYGQGGVTAISR